MPEPPSVTGLSTYAECIFEPGDIVNLRCLPSGKQRWPQAGELDKQAGWISERNQAGDNIYLGVNPRKAPGGANAE